MPRILKIAAALILAAVTFGGMRAYADDFPNRPIRLILNGGAGSLTDVYVRLIAAEIEKQMGQPVIVENLPGGGGILGTRRLISSIPDGYTIGFSSNAYLVQPLTMKDPQYQWPDDFVMVHQGFRLTSVLVVNAALPFKTPQKLLAYAKANPGKLKVGNPGRFTAPQVVSALFQDKAGVKFNDVPYKTMAQTTQGLWSGEVDIVFISPGSYLAGEAAGTMRPLAIMSPQRHPALPNLPTISETTGISIPYSVWNGFVLPKGTSDQMANLWHEQISKALQAPSLQKLMSDQKAVPVVGTRAKMFANADREVQDFKTLIEKMNIEKQ